MQRHTTFCAQVPYQALWKQYDRRTIITRTSRFRITTKGRPRIFHQSKFQQTKIIDKSENCGHEMSFSSGPSPPEIMIARKGRHSLRWEPGLEAPPPPPQKKQHYWRRRSRWYVAAAAPVVAPVVAKDVAPTIDCSAPSMPS